ncbi:MAG: iron-sulfur cluster assembly scaffold protein [Gammaproteobacteria bacterium]|nr:MAG: iron-sulfur cluster assembly scaffold protein [Gammaproteobacteria bacterium]
MRGEWEMDSLDYSQQVRDRFERPANAGRLLGPVISGAAGEEGLGTRVEFDFRLRSGTVEESAFRVYGCPHAIAAASWVAENARDRRLDDTSWMDPLRLAALLEVPEHKLGVLLVVQDALEAAAAKFDQSEDR